jgi:putative ABC transport system ATP-binding protein
MATPILQTIDLTRVVAGKTIVDTVSIAVSRGDVLVIAGPSGAGKSSFLRLLNRLDEPTGGTVLLDGADTRQLPPRELRRRVGMVMQAPILFPGTVADNIRYGPQQRGQDVQPETIHTLLQRVDLPGYADRTVERLSGGEAQRVSLARTLANAPEILLLDEPTSSLDDESEREVETLIRSIIQTQNLTCVIVTHDKQQAARLANRMMMMEDGRLVQIGPVQEVLDAYTDRG